MIVYFLEANKMYTFRLPIEITGNYILTDYDNRGNKRSLVSVEGVDGKWIVRDNDDTKIFSGGQNVRETELKMYSFYQLIIYGNEKIIMYIAPIYDSSFAAYSVDHDCTITIGNDNCDICYQVLSTKQVEIEYKAGRFSFKNLDINFSLYINNARDNSGYINSFDTLFIYGLRLFFINNTIYFNNPDSKVFLRTTNFTTPTPILICDNYQATSDTYHDFYEEKDYFYKTPVFQNSLELLETTIAPPPQKNKNQRDPLLLTIIPSIIMSISSILMGYYAFMNISKKDDLRSNILTIVMCIAMLIGSIVWPFIERMYENLVDKLTEKRRVKRYSNYLKEKENILAEALKNQKTALRDQFLSLDECRETIFRKSPNLFSRNNESDLFLSICLGNGSVPLYSKITFSTEEYTDVDDKLIKDAKNLIEKYSKIENMPYSISLREKHIISFIGSDQLKNDYLNTVLLQLITYHSYQDLKIVILTDNSCSNCLRYLKESKFCFSEDMKTRFFATNFDEGIIISDFLKKELSYRLKSDSKDKKIVDVPYYLILSDTISIYRNLEIVEEVLATEENRGFGLVIFDTKVSNIPEGCSNFVNYTETEGNFFTSNMTSKNIQKFVPEFMNNHRDMSTCISLISNIPLRNQNSEEAYLPDSLGFLEMYGVGKVEQLNILQKWSSSNIVNSLAAPIGVDGNGNTLSLDLHEKKHGPHGLIAGMTGSGKSEFIITYILSLAVNYSPEEVQFVLIDYKGGGLAGAFENRKTGRKLPHLVGTITNLDKSEMKRTLVSINSELHRRQRIFNEAKEKLNTGTIDIYKL